MPMTDEELVRAFEAKTLTAVLFDHAAHVRVGWWYVRHCRLGEAIDRFSDALRGFAAAHGAAGKYHETVTIAYLLAIAERLQQAPQLEWPDFAARYPELFERQPSLLTRYYRDDTLQSARARAAFVMPDRMA